MERNGRREPFHVALGIPWACIILSLIPMSSAINSWNLPGEFGSGYDQPTCNIYGMEDEFDCRLIRQAINVGYEVFFEAVALGVLYFVYRKL